MKLRYYERNILFQEKGNKAIYKYKLHPYLYNNEDQKRSILNMLHDFFWVYRGKGKIVLLNKTLTAEEIVDNLDDIQQDNPCPDTYEDLKQDMREELEQRRPWSPVLYFILDLPKNKLPQKIDVGKSFEHGGLNGGLKQLGRDLYQVVSNAGMEAAGMAKKSDVEGDEVDQAVVEERSLFNTFKKAGPITKATPMDIEFYLKAPFYRELGEVPLSGHDRPPVAKILKHGKTYLRPQKAFIMDIFNDGWVRPDWKHVSIHHGKEDEPGKTSYQASLVLTGNPDDIDKVHNEWLYWLSEFSFPVDVCINFEIKEPSNELKKVRDQKHDMKGELETQYEHNLESELDGEKLDKGTELERKLSKGQPLMEAEVIITVAGRTEEIMWERVKEIKDFYLNRMFYFSVVPSKSVYCFEKVFPWFEMDEYWRFPCDPGFVSHGGIHCTSELGTPSGAWFGITWNSRPILADFGWPMRNNKPGTVILLGSMGSGKSATMKKIIKIVLLLGGYVFIIDPKGEFHKFMENPEIAAITKLIRFGVGMESSKINVFRTSNNRDRAWQTAKNFLSLILNGRKSEARSLLISKLVKLTMDNEHPSMLTFIDILEQFIRNQETDPERRREAEILADMLESYQEDPLAKIIFHDNPDEMSLEQYRCVISDLKGLKMPKKGTDMNNLDDTTKLSLGIVMLNAYIGRELMQHRPYDVLKAFGLDEYWIFEQVEDMEDLQKELVKMSRSQYVVPLLATQEPADAKSTEIRNNIGWVLVGKMENDVQIADACSLMGIEKTEEIIDEFRALESGVFFVRDPLGRKDQIKIYQPSEWMQMFDTTPKPKKADNIEKAV